MANLPRISWPALDASYIDELGRIDKDVYHAGGEIWPWAARFASLTLGDETAGQLTLLKVCAKITEKRANGSIRVENLNPYIKRSFKREMLARLKANRLADGNSALDRVTVSEVDLDRKILIEQIMSRMSAEMRRLTELLILGHSFEEIARKDGTQSNLLRSKYSKQLMKIKRELREGNHHGPD